MRRSGLRCHTGDPQARPNVTAARLSDRQPATTVRSSWPSRSGSASTSIATILPAPDRQGQDGERAPVGRPRHAAGHAVDEDPGRGLGERAEAHRLLGHGLRRRGRARPGPGAPAAIGAHHDVRVEDGEEPFEVTLARRGEERVDDGPLAIEIDVGHGRTLDAATGTARELARGRRRPADDRGDLVERHREDVVQHEGDPFGGRRASRGRRAARARPNRPAGPPARDPGPPRGSRSDPAGGSPGTSRGASCATAAC